MCEDENIDAVRRGIEAFNRRDFETALATLRDDVTWQRWLSRSETDDPVIRGKEELRAIWESQVEAMNTRMEPQEFIAAGDRVIVPSVIRTHGSGSEIDLSMPVTWVWTFDENGLAVRVEIAEER